MPKNPTSPNLDDQDGGLLGDANVPLAPSRRMALASAAVWGGALILGSRGAACAGSSTSDRTGDADGVGTVWWVELIAANDVKSAAHYNSVLGWTSKRDALSDGEKPAQPDEPAYTLFMANGNEVAGAYRANPSDPVKDRPMWIVYFQVDNVDKAISRAVSQGGRLLLSPYDVPGSARMALLADIDGIPFGVAAPL
jgi:predicted enzyme related to lactoylglutathione lyase